MPMWRALIPLQPKRLRLYFWGLLLAILTIGCMSLSAMAQQACEPMSFYVIMATPFSSRINNVGDPLEAILVSAIQLSSDTFLPAGVMLTGRVVGVHPSTAKETGSIRIQFIRMGGVRDLKMIPDTRDGWLRQSDEDTTVWMVSATRSTRLLNMTLQRRLGTNRAVWAQKLGINENVIPDPSTDEFIQTYNQRDVLVGAGDRMRLRLYCY